MVEYLQCSAVAMQFMLINNGYCRVPDAVDIFQKVPSLEHVIYRLNVHFVEGNSISRS